MNLKNYYSSVPVGEINALYFMVGAPMTHLKSLAYGQSKLLTLCCFLNHIHSKSVRYTSGEKG